MFDARVMRALNVNEAMLGQQLGRGGEPAGSARVPSASQGLVRASQVGAAGVAPQTRIMGLCRAAASLLAAVRRATRLPRRNRSSTGTPLDTCVPCLPSVRAVALLRSQQRRSPEAAASPTRAPIHHYCSPCFSHVAERHRKARRSTRTRGLHAAAAPRCTPTGSASTPSSSTA